jgi:hypothetical protein
MAVNTDLSDILDVFRPIQGEPPFLTSKYQIYYLVNMTREGRGQTLMSPGTFIRVFSDLAGGTVEEKYDGSGSRIWVLTQQKKQERG